jgi:hypothetical protein
MSLDLVRRLVKGSPLTAAEHDGNLDELEDAIELELTRGQVSKMDAGTITITTQSVYVTTGLTGTFDSTTANGMTLGTTNAFAVKNTSGATKLMQIYGSIDAKTATGNNKVLGIKLAKNGSRHRSNRVPRLHWFRRGGSQAGHQLDDQHGRQRRGGAVYR